MIQSLLKIIPKGIKTSLKDLRKSKFKWRYFDNFDSLILHKLSFYKLSIEEKKVISDLNQYGYAITNLEKLFPDENVLNLLTDEMATLENDQRENIVEARKHISSGSKKKTFIYEFFKTIKSIDKR